MRKQAVLLNWRRVAEGLGYVVTGVQASLFTDPEQTATPLLDLWLPNNRHTPHVRIFSPINRSLAAAAKGDAKRLVGEENIPFAAILSTDGNIEVMLAHGSGHGGLAFLPPAPNGKLPQALRGCQPFLEILDLRRCVNRLTDVIYAAHGHDRLRLFDTLLVILASKIYDELANPDRLEFTMLAGLDDRALPERFGALAQAALASLGGIAPFFRFDLRPDALREAIRLLASYSFRLTIDLGGQMEVLGTFYQDAVSSTFRGTLGAYFTPKPVADLAAAMCDVSHEDTVFDISCGSGTFLTSAFRQCSPGDERQGGPRIFGCDIQERMVLTSAINCLLHGIASPRIIHGDGLKIDLDGWHKKVADVPTRGFSLIVGNPPFAGFEIVQPPARHGRPSKQRGAGARVHKIIPFIEKVVRLLAPAGRAALVIPTSVLNAEAASFCELRQFLAREVQITGIVNLPPEAFTHTDCGVAGALLLFNRAERGEWVHGGKTFVTALESVGYDRRGQAVQTAAPEEMLSRWRAPRTSGKSWVPTSQLYELDRWDVPWVEGHVNGLLEFDASAFVPLTALCEPVKRTFRCSSLPAAAVHRYFEVGDTDIDTGDILHVHEATTTEIVAKNRLRVRVRAGDILLPNHRDSLVAKTASGIGRSAVRIDARHDGLITSNRFTVLRPRIDPEVCVAVLNSRNLRQQLVLHSRGSASFDIREKVLADVRVPRALLEDAAWYEEVRKLTTAIRHHRASMQKAMQELRDIADAQCGT
ncbi:MAG: N-6 DNA methylase [Gemmataceae bacterium]|nr:N-6 DNA methylase [Gemmataceae bacterium]